MPKKLPHPSDLPPKPRKQYWVSYRLQSLSPEKFVKVTNKILNDDYGMIRAMRPGTQNAG